MMPQFDKKYPAVEPKVKGRDDKKQRMAAQMKAIKGHERKAK